MILLAASVIFNYIPTNIAVPFELRLYHSNGPVVESVRCDATMEEPLKKAFSCIAASDKNPPLTYHGCYAYRNIKGTNKLSNHAFGRAIDLNAGKPMPDYIVQCFKGAGFTWGGDWVNSDPMHFELNVKGR
jgi:hypothetical protein